MGKLFNNHKLDLDQADSFIIGDVALAIPPENISTTRVENNEEFTALRGKFPMIRKTGLSNVYATFTWKAMLVDGPVGVADYTNWEDLRRIVAMFKCAPFVQIENHHLRNILNVDGIGAGRMVFGLKALRITVPEDSIDVIEATMDVVFFNYLPYSEDWAYTTVSNKKVDADESPVFSQYLDNWMADNLDKLPKEWPVTPWMSNNSGGVKLMYRRYRADTSTNPNPQNPGIYFPNSPPEGWAVDHTTNHYSIWYTEEELEYQANTGLQGLDATVVTGITINMVNNLAQIPLSSYVYPTYQHVGPATTTIGIAFVSNDIDGIELGNLQRIITNLNKQYMDLRSAWKKTDSIHGTQALYIDNQILNMFGITAIMSNTLSTSTDEGSLTVQGQLIGTQYENVFESIDKYQIRDTSQAYFDAIAELADPSAAEGLSADDKKAMSSLMAFYAAEAKNDLSYIEDKLATPPSDTRDDEKYRLALSQIPQLAMRNPPIDMSPLLQVANTTWKRFGTPVYNLVPGLQSRVAAKQLSWTDAVFLTGYLKQHGFENSVKETTVLGTVDATSAFGRSASALGLDYRSVENALDQYGLSQTPTYQSVMYKKLFSMIAVMDPAFMTSIETLQKQPKYKDAVIKAGIQPNGPGSDIINSSHGAYNDLGLNEISVGSSDYNPAYYLFNYNTTNNLKLKDKIIETINSANGTLNNKFDTPDRHYVYTHEHLILPEDVKGNDGSALFARTVFNSQNPAQAFPTFKLFLIEDAAGKIVYAYDDFYSYSSVQSLEVIKYRDKPDAVMLKLSNMAGLFSHRFYDNSVEGLREYELDDQAQHPPEDGTVTGPNGIVTKHVADARSGVNYVDGTPGGLKYYPLQTGSKIQVRMGYANNPDKLFPVFSGIVTEISEEFEQITLMAQGFMVELETVPDDGINTDGWGPIGTLLEDDYKLNEGLFNFFKGHWLDMIHSFWDAFSITKKSPAYGGAFSGSDGDTEAVLTQLIKAPTARHFGKWQIDTAGTDPFLRGFGWGPLLANFTPNSVATPLATAYDRSGENIMVNRYLTASGKTFFEDQIALSRPWNFEQPQHTFARYNIPGDPTPLQDPWYYMKDVSRRYPEYILAVKNYGFPWNVNATLVFAHPLDFYRAAPDIPNTTNKPNDNTDAQSFLAWWNGGGKARFLALTKDIRALIRPNNISTGTILNQTITQEVIPDPEDIAKRISSTGSYEQFNSYLTLLSDHLKDQMTPFVLGLDHYLGFGTGVNLETKVNYVKTGLASLTRSASVYIAQAKTGGLSINATDTIQAVRKYHYIGQDHIIHNGITLNGEFNNTVTVGEQTIKMSAFVPPQHVRLLNCNELINDEQHNVRGNDQIRMGYAQSFLGEEVGTMYRGELIIRGTPEIEPFDVVLLRDPALGMGGPIEVDKVIHSFDQENGYITIITPRAMVLYNEAAQASYLAALAHSADEVVNLGLETMTKIQENVGTGGAALGAGLGVGAASELSALISGTMLSPIAVVGSVFLATRGINFLVNSSREMTPILVAPLSRYGKFWIAGMEGWRTGTILDLYKEKWANFTASEWYPLLESWRTLGSIIKPSIGGVSNATPPPSPVTIPSPIATSTVPKVGGVPSSLPVSGRQTSSFGQRKDPISNKDVGEFHQGIDIAAPAGTLVQATLEGTIVKANNTNNGFGNEIIIDNGTGYKTIYGHLASILVQVGQLVKKGQKIGTVGSTGRSTGPHVHYQIALNGKPVDPKNYV